MSCIACESVILCLPQRYEVNPGDTLTTACYFKNPPNNKLKFGLSSDEEMCIDFLLYYPAVENTKFCASESSSSNAFMTNKVIKSDDDHDARLFGIEAGDGDQCKGSAVTVFGSDTAVDDTTVDDAAVSDTCVAMLASAAAALPFVVTAMMN